MVWQVKSAWHAFLRIVLSARAAKSGVDNNSKYTICCSSGSNIQNIHTIIKNSSS